MYRERIGLALLLYCFCTFPMQAASQGPDPEEVVEPLSPVGVWDWTKREGTRDNGLYLVWVYPDGDGVARDGGCRTAITFRWEWDPGLQTLTMIDPNVSGNEAELFFRDQQVDRSYGARTITRTQSLHAPGRELEGLRKPVRGDLLAVVGPIYTGSMHWELFNPDTSGQC